MAHRVHSVAASSVEAHCHIQVGARLVEWPEVPVGDVTAAHKSVHHHTHQPQLFSALQLFDCRRYIDVQRCDAHRLQTLGIGGAPLGNPVVVGLGEGDAVIVLAQARVAQASGRIQHHDVNALQVSILQIALHGDGRVRDTAVLPPVKAVATAGDALTLPELLGQTPAVHGLLVQRMPIRVNDDHTVAHRVLLTYAPCASGSSYSRALTPCMGPGTCTAMTAGV